LKLGTGDTNDPCIHVCVFHNFTIAVSDTGTVHIIPLNNSETYVNGFMIADATELRTG